MKYTLFFKPIMTAMSAVWTSILSPMLAKILAPVLAKVRVSTSRTSTSRGQTRLQKWESLGTQAFPVFDNCSVPLASLHSSSPFRSQQHHPNTNPNATTSFPIPQLCYNTA